MVQTICKLCRVRCIKILDYIHKTCSGSFNYLHVTSILRTKRFDQYYFVPSCLLLYKIQIFVFFFILLYISSDFNNDLHHNYIYTHIICVCILYTQSEPIIDFYDAVEKYVYLPLRHYYCAYNILQQLISTILRFKNALKCRMCWSRDNDTLTNNNS